MEKEYSILITEKFSKDTGSKVKSTAKAVLKWEMKSLEEDGTMDNLSGQTSNESFANVLYFIQSLSKYH